MGKEDLCEIQNLMTSADINAHATSVQKAPAKPRHPTGLNHLARFPGCSYIAVIHFRIRAFLVAVLLRHICAKARHVVGIKIANKTDLKGQKYRVTTPKYEIHIRTFLQVSVGRNEDEDNRRMAGDVKWLEALSEQSD